jgi:toxin ParE1/3/4
MSYRLSRRAEDDLIQIYVSSVEAFGENQAERYQDALEAAFQLIGEFPEIARERPEYNPPVRIHPCKSHVLIYLVGPQGRCILRVRHAREDGDSSPGGDQEALS